MSIPKFREKCVWGEVWKHSFSEVGLQSITLPLSVEHSIYVCAIVVGTCCGVLENTFHSWGELFLLSLLLSDSNVEVHYAP